MSSSGRGVASASIASTLEASAKSATQRSAISRARLDMRSMREGENVRPRIRRWRVCISPSATPNTRDCGRLTRSVFRSRGCPESSRWTMARSSDENVSESRLTATRSAYRLTVK